MGEVESVLRGPILVSPTIPAVEYKKPLLIALELDYPELRFVIELVNLRYHPLNDFRIRAMSMIGHASMHAQMASFHGGVPPSSLANPALTNGASVRAITSQIIGNATTG
jgi:hypothetical protein